MTEPKPCPSCSSRRTQESDDDGYRDCLECGAIFKSALPELPEGYREDEDGDLCCEDETVACLEAFLDVLRWQLNRKPSPTRPINLASKETSKC